MKYLSLFAKIVVLVLISQNVFSHAQQNLSVNSMESLKSLEASFNGKIGVYAINTNNNQIISYRANERFPVQSTLKLIGVSALLQAADNDSNLLGEKIHYTSRDLIAWHPVTGKYINKGMSLGELSAAAIIYSDNPAINLIIKKLGGPKAMTDFARSIGNKTFNVVHYEGELNSNPHNQEDTSTPKDMAVSVKSLMLGNILSKPLRHQLVTWMVNSTTSYKRIRAGVPVAWVVADKTGSGSYGVANDIGMVWSPACKPIILAIYTAGSKKESKSRDDIVAATAEAVLSEFAVNDTCFKALS